MRMCILPLLLAIAPVQPNPREDAIKEELKLFQGTWILASTNIQFLDLKANPMTMVITGDRFVVKSKDQFVAKGKFTIDPTKKFKTIDLIEFETDGKEKQTKAVPGIYVIMGDTRKSCFANAPGDKRPDG